MRVTNKILHKNKKNYIQNCLNNEEIVYFGNQRLHCPFKEACWLKWMKTNN